MWVLAIVLLVLCGPLTLILHEAAHALVALFSKRGSVEEFKPWPHTHNGVKYFGRVTLSGLTPREFKVCLLAPLLKSSLLSVIYASLAIATHPLSLIPMLWEILDLIWWVRGYVGNREHSDGYKFRSIR